MPTEMTIDEPEVAASPPADEVTVTPEQPSSARPSRLSSIDVGGLAKSAMLPILGLVVFVAAWAAVAPMINTSLGTLPGPGEVASAGGDLWDEFQANRTAASEFYAAQDARNEALRAEGRDAEVQDFAFAGATTFPSQVWTSLKTVALGFAIATLFAVPIGLHAAWNSAAWTAGSRAETGLLRMVIADDALESTRAVGTAIYLTISGLLTLGFWLVHRRNERTAAAIGGRELAEGVESR